MASSISIALRRASSPTLLKSLRSVSVAPSVSRSFNTNAQLTTDDDREVSVHRSAERSPSRQRTGSNIFSDVFDPFSPRSLSQVMNLMDQLMENPFVAASRGLGAAGGSRRAWDVKEKEDALLLRMDMPGLDKEDVKVSVEQNTLVVKAEGKEDEEDGGGRRFSSRLDLPPNVYEIDSIKAEMKNGVLKLVLPKVKEEEGKNVFDVKVD